MKKLICLIALLLVFALMLCACGESVSVVGAMINENGELVVTMSDGTTETVGKVNEPKLQDFDVTYKWTSEGQMAIYTITMDDGSKLVKTFPMLKEAKTLEIKDKSVKSVASGTGSYPVMSVVYADGSKGEVTVTPDMIIKGSIDFTTIGKYDITIFYNGAYVEETVWVLDQNGSTISLSGNIIYQSGISETASTKDFATNANGGIYGQDVDYPVNACKELKTALNSKTDGAISIQMKNDSIESGEGDLLVGCTNYPETQAVLHLLAPNEYAISAQNGKIVIAAWNDVTLKAAIVKFKQMINSGVSVVNGSAIFPDWQGYQGSVETNWVTDFPYPSSENVALTATQDVGDDSLLHVFTGTGVNRNAYVAYCNQLVAAGYTLHGTAKQLEGSSFATYVNNTKGIVLQVSHLAYTHATAQGVDLYEPAIRVVSSSTIYVTLPDTDIMDPNLAYTKICESTITSMKFNYEVGSWGSGYIIRLEDGSFVIVDGGYATGWDDHVYLKDTIMNLYHEVFPENPTANEPLHIRAWILTHEHIDHFNLFKKFVENYGAQSWLRIDHLLSNFTSTVECYNTTNPEYTIRNSLTNLQDKVVNGFDYIKVHTGQTFYFANLKIETLHTHEDLYPTRLAYFNNSSSVFRLTFTHNGTDADSFLVLGDAERLVSKHLRAMYGSALQSDMVQVAHHGYNGVEAALYDLVNPTIVWFPSSTSRYTNDSKAGYSFDSPQWMRAVNHHLCWEISSVKLIIMADTWDTTMDFVNGKAQMNSLRDINNPEKEVKHDDKAVIYTAQRT